MRTLIKKIHSSVAVAYSYLKMWLYWYYIPKDEFHHSLDLDDRLLLHLSSRAHKGYLGQNSYRRHLAHERSVEERKRREKQWHHS